MADRFDFEAGYVDTVGRISAVARTPGIGTTLIAACPAWTVHHLVCHLAGLADDWIQGRLDGYAGDQWTAAQIERHRMQRTVDVLDAWAANAAQLIELPDHPSMGTPARWAFGDALVHEADLLESIGSDQQPPAAAVSTHLSAGLRRWSPTLTEASIRLQVNTHEGRTWTVGADAGGAVISLGVSGPAYELWRAVYGRRHRAAVAAMSWDGDPSVVIATGLPYPFTYPGG